MNVAWTAVALQALHNRGFNPQVEALIVGFVNAWATNNGGGWAMHSVHNYNGGPPWYTATAQKAGPNTVNIIGFL